MPRQYVVLLVAIIHVYSVASEISIKNLFNVTMQHPDSPFYDSRTDLLYFDDRGKIYCYNQNLGRLNYIVVGNYSSPILPLKRSTDTFLIGVDNTLEILQWSGNGPAKNRTVVTNLFQDDPLKQYNDGKADKNGRAWMAIFTFDGVKSLLYKGLIYKVTKENIANPEVVVHNITDAEGFTFNKANTKFYYADTHFLHLYETDFDLEAGTIKNPRIIFDIKESGEGNEMSAMASMTRDEDDFLWIGVFNDGVVLKLDPKTGKVVQRVAIPFKQVINLTWGGKNMDILYVTAANITDTGTGAVFAVTGLGARGEAVYEVDL